MKYGKYKLLKQVQEIHDISRASFNHINVNSFVQYKSGPR